jgi:hypothetical protein
MMSAEITRCVSMPRRARPGRQLEVPLPGQAASAVLCLRVPWVAVTGSQARPVVMTACNCRKIAAAMTVWAGLARACSAPCWSGTGTGRCRPGWRAGLPRPRARRQPQPGSSLAGQPGPAGERAGQFLPRRQTRVLHQRPSGREPLRVTGPGHDRRRAHSGQAGDRGGQRSQAELVHDAGHPLLSVGEPGLGEQPVFQQQLHPLEHAGTVRSHTGRVAEGCEQPANDPQTRLLPAAPGDLPPYRLPGPCRAEPGSGRSPRRPARRSPEAPRPRQPTGTAAERCPARPATRTPAIPQPRPGSVPGPACHRDRSPHRPGHGRPSAPSPPPCSTSAPAPRRHHQPSPASRPQPTWA